MVLEGLGDVAPPQEPLGEARRRNVIAIWEAILRAAGAVVHFEDMPLSGEPDSDLPDVKEVPLEQGPTCDGGVSELDSADVAFLPDSANFANPETVRKVLDPVATQLVGSGAIAAPICTTADAGDLQGQRKLSFRRAEAVRAELIALGVRADRLTVEGLGSDFPRYVEDHLPDGTLDPGAAALNRKVFIDPACHGREGERGCPALIRGQMGAAAPRPATVTAQLSWKKCRPPVIAPPASNWRAPNGQAGADNCIRRARLLLTGLVRPAVISWPLEQDVGMAALVEGGPAGEVMPGRTRHARDRRDSRRCHSSRRVLFVALTCRWRRLSYYIAPSRPGSRFAARGGVLAVAVRDATFG